MKIVVQEGLSSEEMARLTSLFPDMDVVTAESEDEALEAIVDAEIYFGRIPRSVFLKANKLRWIQVFGAGVETQLFPELIESDVILTCTSGAFNNVVADHAFALILAIARHIPTHVRNQDKGIWDRSGVCHQIAGQTVGIIGLGNIGSEIAKRAHVFGMKVLAVDMRSMECPDFVDRLCGLKDMDKVLKNADYLVVIVPLTKKTRGMIGAAELSKMKPTANLINVGRGPIVDQAALIDALKNGVIAGVGTDVFENEPIEPESELWNLKNVVMTPHIAGPAPESRAASFEIFLENIKRFLAGEDMISVIDKREGF